MKIEKVNENQIRCTLTREDLASRELKISELAYGTEKAKNLFRDMMQQANFEFGFEAEDIPLMIEAIPLNAECIVLIITKVEDPEELDTRFARFAPSVSEDLDAAAAEYEEMSSSEEVANFYQRLQEIEREDPIIPPPRLAPEKTAEKRTRTFQMASLNQVMEAAAITGNIYTGLSALFKDEHSGKYLLALTQDFCDSDTFDRVCNTISEYGDMKRSNTAARTFLEEHYDTIIPENALQILGNI